MKMGSIDAILVSCGIIYMVTLVGPPAMISYEPRQARKGATVVTDSCAEVRLAELPLSLTAFDF